MNSIFSRKVNLADATWKYKTLWCKTAVVRQCVFLLHKKFYQTLRGTINTILYKLNNLNFLILKSLLCFNWHIGYSTSKSLVHRVKRCPTKINLNDDQSSFMTGSQDTIEITGIKTRIQDIPRKLMLPTVSEQMLPCQILKTKQTKTKNKGRRACNYARGRNLG